MASCWALAPCPICAPLYPQTPASTLPPESSTAVKTKVPMVEAATWLAGPTVAEDSRVIAPVVGFTIQSITSSFPELFTTGVATCPASAHAVISKSLTAPAVMVA